MISGEVADNVVNVPHPIQNLGHVSFTQTRTFRKFDHNMWDILQTYRFSWLHLAKKQKQTNTRKQITSKLCCYLSR